MGVHDDDIDAEFASLVARMGAPAEAGGPPGPARGPDDTPVDESLHLDGGRLSVALVLAPIARPAVSVVRLGALTEVLHQVLTLSGAPVLGLVLVLAVSLSARHALTARAPR